MKTCHAPQRHIFYGFYDCALLAALFFAVPGHADPSVGRLPAAAPAAELHSQDRAYALLSVAYRELQTYLIERDYENRLQAAATKADAGKRAEITRLAARERDLRLQQLSTNLTNLASTYTHARGEDERRMGVSAPSIVDTAAAARDFHNLVAIVPDRVDDSGQLKTKSIPIDTFLAKPAPALPLVALLKQTIDTVPGLPEAVASAILSSPATRTALEREPTLPVLVSYRLAEGRATNLVVQVFSELRAESLGILKRGDMVAALFAEDWAARCDLLARRLAAPALACGDPAAVPHRQQLWQQLWAGNTDGLLEDSATPLQFALVLPAAQSLMPVAFRDRVSAAVLHGEIAAARWQAVATLVAKDEASAEQIARLVASSQMLFAGLSRGKGAPTSLSTLAQAALRDMTITTRSDCVRLTGSVAGPVAQKVCLRAGTKLQGMLATAAPLNLQARQ